MTEAVRIGLTGDVLLGRKVDERQQYRPADAVWGTVLDFGWQCRERYRTTQNTLHTLSFDGFRYRDDDC